MSPFLLGLLSASIVGVAASLYYWIVRRRQDETADGVLALSAMRWREFAGLVIEMLYRRGYAAADRHPLGSGDQSDIVLKREDGLCVVSCKHGSAYRLGRNAVDELGDSIRMNDAAGGIMVTPGGFSPEALEQAGRQRIELVDGKALWPEIAALVPEPLRRQVEAGAAARAKRSIGFGWLIALAFGAAIALLLPGNMDAAPSAAPSATAPAIASAETKADGAPVARPDAPPTSQQIEQRRKDAASAIAALPGIERALWSTQSTLALDVSDDRADRWDGICGILGSYEELRATRVQINPPPGSSAPVRFKQCHAY